MLHKVLFLVAVVPFGCAHKQVIPGTTVEDSADNRVLIQIIENYRQRLLEKNVEGLLVLASAKYFEDSGTPNADDDYGYDGLKDVLMKRLARVRSLRYDIHYKQAKIVDGKAEVEVYIDGSFELGSETGERYRRVNDVHRFVLQRQGNDKWKFLSGM